MAARLHVVVSCTNRKRHPVPPDLCLSAVRADSLRERARLWSTRLADHPGATVAARNLYAGDHWAVALNLPDEARRVGHDVVLWVASAGYGLVASSMKLHPYSATFVPGDPDSVTNSGMATAEVLQAWWAAMAAWAGPEPGAPRLVAALAKSDPHAGVLVVGSPSYVEAMGSDLAEAVRTLADARRFLIVSSQAPVRQPQLEDHLIRATASAQPRVGGSLGSLHVRVARELLRQGSLMPLRVDAARAWYAPSLEESHEPVTRPARTRMTDEDVRTFVARALAREPKVTRTIMLQRLRQTGRACEQARFGKLFDEVRAGGRRGG